MKSTFRGIDRPARAVNALPATNTPYTVGTSNAWEVDRYAREGLRGMDLPAILVSCWEEAYPEPPLKVYDREDESVEITDARINELISHPLPGMSWQELMEIDIMYTLLSGTTYLHKRRNSRGDVVQLMPYSDAVMTGVSEVNSTEWISYFRFNNRGGRAIDVPRTDVVVWPWIVRDPIMAWKGLSPFRPGARQFDTDIEFTKTGLSMLYNGAFPGLALGLETGGEDGPMMDADLDAIKEYVEQNYGAENRGHPIVLGGKITSVKLQSGLSEMMDQQNRVTAETRACGLFRVPPILAYSNAGLQRSTFANVQESRLFWHLNTVVPFWKRRAAMLTESLRADFPETDFVLRYDLSRVDALHERNTEEQRQGIEGYKEGILTLTEARHAFPYPDEVEDESKLKKPVVVNIPPTPEPSKKELSKGVIKTNGQLQNV